MNSVHDLEHPQTTAPHVSLETLTESESIPSPISDGLFAAPPTRRRRRTAPRHNGRRAVLALLVLAAGIAYLIFGILNAQRLAAFSPSPIAYVNLVTPIMLALTVMASSLFVLLGKRSPRGKIWTGIMLLILAVTVFNAVSYALQAPNSWASITSLSLENTANIVVTALCAALTVIGPIAECFYPLYLCAKRSALRAVGVTMMVMSAIITIVIYALLMNWQIGDNAVYIRDIWDTVISLLAILFGYAALHWATEDNVENEDDSDMKIAE